MKLSSVIHKASDTTIDTDTGRWHFFVYVEVETHLEHIALVKGTFEDSQDGVLTRVHS